jgi:hypothetical protein
MTDPERLLETDLQDATSLRERELLGSLKPSAGTRTAVWQHVVGQGVLVAGAAVTASTAVVNASAASNALAASVEVAANSVAMGATSAAGVTSAAAGTVTATTGLMSSLAAKAGVALIVAVPVLGGTVYLTQGAEREAPAAVAAKPVTVVEVAPKQPTASEPAVPVEQGLDTPAVPPPEAIKPESSSAESQSKADALREENRLLREARSLDRAGNPGQALHILNELDRLFARGALLQEREILRIQALTASGSASAAKTRAEQFLKRYPASPYAAHVRSMLDGSAASRDLSAP